MITAYLLTGSNLGQREEFLQKAVEQISIRAGKCIGISSLYETAPWGKTDQPSFLNQAIKLETTLSPLELLTALLEIEQELGITRQEKYGPRTIDIDILLYGNEVIDTPQLQVPHPQMAQRRFALLPLLELSPQLIHPAVGISMKVLLDQCPDEGLVHQLK
ncbi:MAG: 2-amino-4-hydroxy-6-hydroxymethyldihydropteridine diphosphokinase [Chitinophagaceae bacterium]